MVRETERFTDLTQEGSNGEPDEEGDEESQPGAVKGTHVGTGEREEFDLRSAVILIRIDGERVGLKLFPEGRREL